MLFRNHDEVELKVLTEKELEARYGKIKSTNIAKFTDEAIANGFQIGMIHYFGLKFDNASEWLAKAERAVSWQFKGLNYKIGMFTDLSDVNKNDNLYFSFKTKETPFQIAHSLSGHDSEGFIYNP